MNRNKTKKIDRVRLRNVRILPRDFNALTHTIFASCNRGCSRSTAATVVTAGKSARGFLSTLRTTIQQLKR